MSNRPNKRSDPGSTDRAWIAVIVLIAVVAILVGPAYAGWVVGGHAWSAMAIATAVLLYVVVIAAAVAVVMLVRRARTGRVWTDDRAKVMSTRADIAPLTERVVAKDTARLGPRTIEAGVGVPIGKAVLTKQDLYGPWEFTQLWFLGPRMGKTTSLCIPQLVSTGGPAISTANKRDFLDATRGPRSEIGHVWVHDPQQLAGEPASWWWNPLTFITSGFGKVSRAEELAGLFQASYASPNASTDAYFGPGGETLLSDLLLAAAVGGEPITTVLDWLTSPDTSVGHHDPIGLLREHGLPRSATSLQGYRNLNPRQRDGLYGTASGIMKFVRETEFDPWIVPAAGHDTRRQFDPAAFVRSTDTLYMLSQDGAGSARAITAALTNAIFAAARDYATGCPGGRLPVPLLCELDEAANICRLPNLPEQFSYFGSMGVILVVILQSRRQGVRVWGEDGMQVMLSNASVMGVGGGIRETQYLQDLSAMVGDYERLRRSRSVGTHGHRSTSSDVRTEAIFTVAELAKLPRFRAITFVAGQAPVLVDLIPWTRRPEADLIQASKDCYEPTGLLT